MSTKDSTAVDPISAVAISAIDEGVRIRVHAQPGASRTQISGLHGQSLKIKIHAPPEDGKANAELCKFLAEVLGVAKSAVVLVSGASSRAKVVEARGVSREDAVNRLVFGGSLKVLPKK